MRRTVPPVLCLLLCPLLLGAAPARRPPAPEATVPVVLQAQPGTALDAAARQLAAQDLGEARQARDRPLVLVGTARLSDKAGEKPALLVQLQSARECGSAGCGTQVYVDRGGRWVKVLDGAEGRVAVSSRHTRGMADLVSDGDRYVWDGSAYRNPNPAPAIDLRPRRRR